MKTSAKTRGATTHQEVSFKPLTVPLVLSSVIRVHSRLFAVPSAIIPAQASATRRTAAPLFSTVA
jgi:hypothetical protein